MHDSPIDALQWATDNADQLRPPVCNKRIFKGEELDCMLVAGPNERSDFHINPTEEFFYQIKGRLVLTVLEDCDDGKRRREIKIDQGKCYLLPALIPHNPRREEESLGLVIERRRPSGAQDKIVWYCRGCNAILNEYSFQCKDLDVNILEAINSNNHFSDQLCTLCGNE